MWKKVGQQYWIWTEALDDVKGHFICLYAVKCKENVVPFPIATS